jgi:hypothetical protein
MGLLKTGLKAAVAVKTADVIHERIQARQQAQWAAYGQPGAMPGAPAPAGMPAHAAAGAPVAPAPAPAVAVDNETMLAQLTQLGELRASGVLTDAEFEAQKARILAG